ncbi:MAG: PIN domain-containing protein [Verrucomicrobiota bacterium]|nr:PIN domain-containing protein [Verrucomicrobiota bacterium]
MIFVDVNLLVYIVNADSPFHAPAKAWWERELKTGQPVCLSWNSLYGFLRVITNQKALPQPLTIDQALHFIEDWLALAPITLIAQTDDHFKHLKKLLAHRSAASQLITDAHFAALSLEYDCEICTVDGDFSKFPGIRWKNPFAQPK